jgi:hypothetical protein
MLTCPYHDDDEDQAGGADCDGTCQDGLPPARWLLDAIEDDDPSPYAGTYSEA